MHTYCTPKTQRTKSVAESKRESTVTSLQKFILCLILFATLMLAPVAAVPSLETDDTQVLWECKNPNTHLCKYTTLTLPPNETLQLPSSGRDLKLRTSQKKSADISLEYLGKISDSGDVVFTNSPIVTGLHLQEAVTGSVHLQTKADTSRPEFCHVYDVFELSLDNYPVGSETLVKYTLPLSEIEEKGYNPIDITLCIYEENTWQKLYTIYSIDDQNAYFESVTTSLGTFAIVSDEGSDDDFSQVRINTGSMSPVTLDISPTCFVTHPVSYTAIV